MTLDLLVITTALGILAMLAILVEPPAARLAAGYLERSSNEIVSVLRAHAAARDAARKAYRNVYRERREYGA